MEKSICAFRLLPLGIIISHNKPKLIVDLRGFLVWPRPNSKLFKIAQLSCSTTCFLGENN